SMTPHAAPVASCAMRKAVLRAREKSPGHGKERTFTRGAKNAAFLRVSSSLPVSRTTISSTRPDDSAESTHASIVFDELRASVTETTFIAHRAESNEASNARA